MSKNEHVRLLGIDPGTNIMGFAVIEVRGKKLHIINMGIISMTQLGTHQEKLKRIFVRLQEIIDEYQPLEMALEAPFYGKNVQSMLKLGRAQGVAMAAGLTKGLEISEYAPRKVKQSVTGSGKASKEQVAAMLMSIYGVPLHSQTLDATDALGVATCHYYQSFSAVKGQKRYKDWSSYANSNPKKLK